MNAATIANAAARIAQARKDGVRLDKLPADCQPDNADTGYAIQDALHDRLGTPVAGFKIGCTTAVMQRFLDIAQPCAGSILETDVHKTPATLSHAAFRRVGVECEIAVRLGTALPPSGAPYTRHTVADAVASCMAAIEIVDDRYVDYKALDAPTLIADDFFGAGCVLGPEVVDWQSLDLAAADGMMTINGSEVGRGTGAHVMGHPFEALAWLANTRAERGLGLAANDIILTGSIVETHWLAAGDRVAIEIAGLGTAEVTLD
ncbi:MAG: hydratase [Alphaproteobacteria bacterium]|nr:hydratase [Alphaproteobacteria bacterium]